MHHISQGFAITFSNLTQLESYPLIFGRDAAAPSTPVSESRYHQKLRAKIIMGNIFLLQIYLFFSDTLIMKSQQLLSWLIGH